MDNKRMCTMVDEFDHGLYDDDDDLGGLIRNILDFPVESLDGGDDDLSDDWASELGPIPSEVFGDILPPVGVGNAGGCSDGGGGGRGGGSTSLTECDSKAYRVPKSFEAPSPDSVLVRRISNSAGNTVLFGPEIAVPVRARTKRLRSRLQSGPGLTTWSKSLQQFPFQKMKKKRKNLPKHDANEVNKCTHCEITKTPQWREGPMGPKTLCNACGVRYRSGRLFPEYRPAASPTFVPSLHSNWHRKVVEMRQGGSHG